MVLNPVALARKSPLLFRFVGFSRKITSQFGCQARIPENSVKISGFMGYSSCCSSNSAHGSWFKDFGCSKTGFVRLGFESFWVLAVSDGGSGRAGGFGGFGDGNSGGRSDWGDGGNNWSLLSWKTILYQEPNEWASTLVVFARLLHWPHLASVVKEEQALSPDLVAVLLMLMLAMICGCFSHIIGYLALLAKYPVLTKAVTSALLTFIGDLICQLAIDQVPSLDMKRTFLFTLLGLVLVGPTLHFWYFYLSKLVTLPGMSGAFLRLILDQFLFTPVFIGVFLSTLVTLEGRPSEVVPKLQQERFSAVLANWQLWIPFQFLNFRFVPQQFQVLAANVVALVWNVILSFKAHKEILAK